MMEPLLYAPRGTRFAPPPFREMRTRARTCARFSQFAPQIPICDCDVYPSSLSASPSLSRLSIRKIVKASSHLCATDQDLVDGNVDWKSEFNVSNLFNARNSSDVEYVSSEYL
jgi:hypothetical protein